MLFRWICDIMDEGTLINNIFKQDRSLYKMKNIFMLLFAILLISTVSAEMFGYDSNAQDTIYGKTDNCVQLLQNCATCTFSNISAINSPNNNTFIIRSETSMSKSGSVYNFTFCNTSQIGIYQVSGHGNINGSDNQFNYMLIINGYGGDLSTPKVFLIILLFAGILVSGLFFFTLSQLFTHPGTKIFFISLSVITFIVGFGILSSTATSYLSELNGIVSILNAFYIVLVVLGSVAMIFLIGWLIKTSLEQINKARNLLPDDA